VGVGDVVEAEELPRAPTNQCTSVLAGHGRNLDLAHLESRANIEELVAAFMALEAGGGPRTELYWPGELGILVHVQPFHFRISHPLKRPPEVVASSRPKLGGNWETTPP